MTQEIQKNKYSFFIQLRRNNDKGRWFQIGLLTGSKQQNNSENKSRHCRKPQELKPRLVQRRCNTACLTFSAGSPFGNYTEMQTAFVHSAMKNETFISLGFRVTDCSKIHSFCSNQKLSVKDTLRDVKEDEKLSLRAY